MRRDKLMSTKKRTFKLLSMLVFVSMLFASGHVLADDISSTTANQLTQSNSENPESYDSTERQESIDLANLRSDERYDGPRQDLMYTADGLLYVDNRRSINVADSISINAIESTGGPDDFGYTWERVEEFDWIDVSTGTDTGIDSVTKYSGMIDIGFDFRYYENTYNKIYISRHGFVSFNDENLSRGQSQIPSPTLPNDVIAPHWVPSDDINFVKYQTSGSSPDRWFVVEWNQLLSTTGQSPDVDNSIYTFELILFEDGDIQFQYKEMSNLNSWTCQTSGIEDSDGLDGLEITSFCQKLESNIAVRIARPEDSARLSLKPSAQRGFAKIGQPTDFLLTLLNSGDFGTDNFSLELSSSWSSMLYMEDGITPISTPVELEQSESMTIIARVTAPEAASVGDWDEVSVTATSTLDGTKSKTVSISAVIPAPFTQVLFDDADMLLSTYLVKPESQEKVILTGSYQMSGDMSVVELPNSNLLYAWNQWRCVEYDEINCVRSEVVILYSILDRWGNEVHPATELSNLSGMEYSPVDSSPYLAVAPNGNVGVIWYRNQQKSLGETQGWTYNSNIFFAILRQNGTILLEPENITKETSFYGWGENGFTRYENPRLGATEDGRFFLAWLISGVDESGKFAGVIYSIRDHTGNKVVGISMLTGKVTGDTFLAQLALTELSGNHVFISWKEAQSESYWMQSDTVYTVVNSSGEDIRAQDYLGFNAPWSSDIVQLIDGTIILAGRSGEGIGYILFDDTNYNSLGTTTWLLTQWYSYNNDVSVTKAADGHAILTWWSNVSGGRLVYALIANDGTIVTAPMEFYTPGVSPWGSTYVMTSRNGQGNTSYSDNFPPYFSSFPVTAVTEGDLYSYAVITDHPDLPSSDLTLSAPTLPTWLTFLDHGNGTATLSGVPENSHVGVHNVVLKVEDSSGLTATQTFIVTVNKISEEGDFQIFLPLILR